MLNTPSFRYKFCLAYDGGSFQGSQKQTHGGAVFNKVESVFMKVFRRSIRCVPCGRTDSGVHARSMVFHADFPFLLDEHLIMDRLNNHLRSSSLVIRSLCAVPSTFHALSSASARFYDYFFTFDPILPHYLLSSVTLIKGKPVFIPSNNDLEMLFLGRRNMRKLSNHGSAKTTVKTMTHASIKTMTYSGLFDDCFEIYRFRFGADGFLYRMMRHIVGLLLHCMMNFNSINTLRDCLCIHRNTRYSLAPCQGLHLSGVYY